MSIDPQSPLTLPDRPNLRHLKDQAKDLLDTGGVESLTDAQFQVARRYGFASWPKLKAHVEAIEQLAAAAAAVEPLKHAIDTNDIDQIKTLMTAYPALHRAPLGYGRNGPLTWVAECRVPWEPPGPTRLAIAKWMIENGSDVHQGGDGPLMRASLGERIPMMELLVAHGADVNAEWGGIYPIIFGPCECVDPPSLKWLLDHGANPNCARAGRKYPGTALDFVIGAYVRSPALGACIDLLVNAGGMTTYNIPPVLAVLRGSLDHLRADLDADAGLVHQRFPTLDFGTSGGRRLTLEGTTLLHVAAEYQDLPAATLLLERGADVNARAIVDGSGVGGQTALFHAATQFEDAGLPMVRLLLDRGADASLRARVPGHYERLDEVIDCTALGYALRFLDETRPGDKAGTVAFLRQCGAPE